MSLDYQPGHSRRLEGGTVEFPPLLDISFDWGTTFDDDSTTTVAVNQEIVVTVAEDPVRLIAVMGIVRNSPSWEVVARLVGPEAFEEGVRCVLDGRLEPLEIQVDSTAVDSLSQVWTELLAAARDGTLKVLPRRPTDREDELFELVTSDPNFFSDGVRLLRQLYGDEAVDRAFPDGPNQ